MTSWAADGLVARVMQLLTDVADVGRAPAMAAYMKDQFAFLGVGSIARRRAVRPIVAALPRPGQQELVATVDRLWNLPEREYQYVGADLLQAHAVHCDATLIHDASRWITVKPWWDTTDSLATRVVGPLVHAKPELSSVMDSWAAGDNLWLARTAILHQLLWGSAVDTDRLLRYCLERSGDPDFFIRKAIGWALRHHARTDPDAVAAFVQKHRDQLSRLSTREAMRHL